MFQVKCNNLPLPLQFEDRFSLVYFLSALKPQIFRSYLALYVIFQRTGVQRGRELKAPDPPS